MLRISAILAAASVYFSLVVLVAATPAEDVDPGRAPSGAVTNPGDLFKEADGTEFRFGYLPSFDRLRLLVLRPPKQFTRWEMALRMAGKTGVLIRQEGKLPMPAAGETVRTPPLADGTYEITLTLVAADGQRREIKRPFERKHFPWENSPLGRDRVVIPPFTPLVVDEAQSSVGCVLRRHELDGVGLWRQVSSEDRPLLTAPVRLEIESGGKTHVAQGQAVVFLEKAADRVRGGSPSWTAGPVRGSTEFEFDYDGLMKVTLHLQPTAERIDAMQLVIPMKTGEAWLMHPVTDYLRFHYAGRIPNGKGKIWDNAGKTTDVKYTATGEPDANGKVWDSSHMSRWQLPAPFVSYIWMGSPERGICWMAENDRDWSLDPRRPMLEIRRQGDSTSLIVRFITKPMAITRPRTIVFGLMATPAKPMPETPVSFRRWWPSSPNPKTPDVVNFIMLGSSYYWGSATPWCAFYPAFKNFSVWDEFARIRQGGAVDWGFTNRWIAQYSPEELRLAEASIKTYGHKTDLAFYRSHIDWSLRLFDGGKWRLHPGPGQTAYILPYTNSRCANWGDEIRTYLDQWSTYDIADPRWPGEERFLRDKTGGYKLATFGGNVVQPGEALGVAYAIDPVPSRQDMILYYCKRMLETFADGINFDDYFLAPNYCPLGPGYVDDEGRLHAGVNLFAFHDLTKRMAVMQHQMGLRPLIYPHMTNGNVVPMFSFGTMITDHEWRDSGANRDKTFQERLGLDEDTGMLLAQSTGLQSGCLCVLVDRFFGDERLTRSALGVALTHELKLPLYSAVRGVGAKHLSLPLGDCIAQEMSNFGYGLRDCRVWRYWDEPQPIKTTGAAVKTLTLGRGGKAMIVVTSYGPGGDVRLDLDRDALGLADDVAAVNVENGERLERLSPGQFTLKIPQHDFRLVRIERKVP